MLAISPFNHRYHQAFCDAARNVNNEVLQPSFLAWITQAFNFLNISFLFQEDLCIVYFIFFFVDTERTQLTLTGSTGKGSVSIEKTTNTKEKRKWDKKILAC